MGHPKGPAADLSRSLAHLVEDLAELLQQRPFLTPPEQWRRWGAARDRCVAVEMELDALRESGAVVPAAVWVDLWQAQTLLEQVERQLEPVGPCF